MSNVTIQERKKANIYTNITDDISGNCLCSASFGSHTISRFDIVNSVKQMRLGENDGFDGFSSDYILYSPLSFLKCVTYACYIIVIPLIPFAYRHDTYIIKLHYTN